uniref:Polymeric immunoglobulin receptor n=1 Tax=Oreochromis niloticus TaxID=8128 RepID=A0A669AWX1_ORENI
MQRLFILTLSLIPWIPAVLCWVSTKKEFTGPEGGSLTVECRYGSHYDKHVKYWCHGWTTTFCEILARTDETSSANQDKVSISDDRGKYMFTVTMKNLKETDSGWYSCGVIIGNEWQADDIANTEVKVFHGVRVVNRIVSGEEGSSLTVQCLYTLRLRLSEKKWCRRGDASSCLSTGSKGSYEDASVAISDDITGAFNVTLKKLQMSDAGGYLCSAGQQQVDVQVQVRPHGSTKTEPVTTPPTPSQPWYHYRYMLESIVGCSSLLLLVGLAVLARKILRKKASSRFKETEEIFPDNPKGMRNLQRSKEHIIKIDNKEENCTVVSRSEEADRAVVCVVDPEKASSRFKETEEIFPDNPKGMRDLQRSKEHIIKIDNKEKASSRFKETEEIFPDNRRGMRDLQQSKEHMIKIDNKGTINLLTY